MLSPDKAPKAPLDQQLKAYMELNGLTQTGFARKCKSSAGTIASVLRGEKVADHVVRRIEAVIDGRELASEGGDIAPLDPMTELMIQKIVTDGQETGRIAGIGNSVYRKWRELNDIEEDAAYATEMLRQYLNAESDANKRLAFLLELCDLAKKPMTK